MKKALVTGATGFVGANLAKLLLKRGRTVRVLTRASSDKRNLPDEADAERIAGDLRDSGSLQRAVEGCDEVYHVAADYRFWAPNPEEVYANNVEGTRLLLQACENAQTPRIIYTSTVGTMGLASEPKPCDEHTPLKPGQMTGSYKKSKWQAEQVALGFAQKGLPVVIVNPSAPIGPWDRKPTPTGQIVLDFVKGKIPAYVHTGLNFVHVQDVAEGQIAAAEKGRPGERYILGHENLTMLEFLQLLERITGRKAPRIRIPYVAAWLAGYANTRYADWMSHRPPGVALEAVKMSKRFMFFDSSKAVRELSFPQTPVQKAAEDAVSWFATNGYF